MSSIQSVSIHSEKPWNAGRVKRRYLVTLLDNNSVPEEIISMPIKVIPSDDGSFLASELLQSNKDNEISSRDIATEWNDTQADYDRKALGIAMAILDVDDYLAYIPLFQAMEARGGANAGQRAAYLGVSTINYNLMSVRFGDAQGVAGGVATVNAQVWEEVPEEFK